MVSRRRIFSSPAFLSALWKIHLPMRKIVLSFSFRPRVEAYRNSAAERRNQAATYRNPAAGRRNLAATYRNLAVERCSLAALHCNSAEVPAPAAAYRNQAAILEHCSPTNSLPHAACLPSPMHVRRMCRTGYFPPADYHSTDRPFRTGTSLFAVLPGREARFQVSCPAAGF